MVGNMIKFGAAAAVTLCPPKLYSDGGSAHQMNHKPCPAAVTSDLAYSMQIQTIKNISAEQAPILPRAPRSEVLLLYTRQ